MSSQIEWLETDDGTKGETWNPITGCSPVSPGCLNCYAAAIANRGMCDDHKNLTKITKRRNDQGKLVKRPVFNGTINLHPHRLRDPLRWRKGKRIFVNSMSDLFHEDVPFEFIAAIYGVMILSPQHTFLILTKRSGIPWSFFDWLKKGPIGRAERLNASMRQYGLHKSHVYSTEDWPPRNVQLGFSAEDQPNWDARYSEFKSLSLQAAVRWVSVEPMLGPIDMKLGKKPAVDWVVVGGESGSGARPFDVAWATSIVEQCDRAKVPVFVKQLGTRPVRDGLRIRLGNKKGGDPHEWTGALAPLKRRDLVGTDPLQLTMIG